MAYKENAKIVFSADTAKYEKSLKSLEAKTKKLQEAQAKLAKGGAIAFGAASAAAVSLINTYKIQEQAEIQVAAALRAMNKEQSISLAYMKKVASDFQKVSTYGDEASLGVLAIGLRLGDLNKNQMPKFLELSADLATNMGTGIPQAGRLMARIMGEPAAGLSMLTRYGIKFTDQQRDMVRAMQESGRKMEAQNFVMDEMRKKLKDSARAQLEGTGIITAAANAFGDLQEKIGEALFKAIRPFYVWVKKVSEALAETNFPYYTSKVVLFTGAVGALKLGVAALIGVKIAWNKIMIALATSAARARIAMAAFWGAATLGIGAVIAFMPEIIRYWFLVEKYANIASVAMKTNFALALLKVEEAYLKLKRTALETWDAIMPGDQSEGVREVARELEALARVREAVTNEATDEVVAINEAADAEAKLLEITEKRKKAQEEVKDLLKDATTSTDTTEETVAEPSVFVPTQSRDLGTTTINAAQVARDNELLRMELEGREAMEVEFARRRQEIALRFAEAQNIFSDEQRALELENINLHRELLDEQEAEYKQKKAEQEAKEAEEKKKKADDKRKAELAATKKHQQMLISLSMKNAANLLAVLDKESKAAAMAMKAYQLYELYVNTTANAAKAYAQAVATIPFPFGSVIGTQLATQIKIGGAIAAAGIVARKAQAGGVVDGAYTPRDSRMIYAQPGEHIVPLGKSWEQVRQGILLQAQQSGDVGSPQQQAPVEVKIEFNGDAGEMFRAAIKQEQAVNG